MEIEPPDTLLGLYQGIPLTERHWDYGNALPDRILLFQGPLERESDDEDDLVVAIGETLIHEIGHYFGLSEEEIEAIEERYWRGDAMTGRRCDASTRTERIARVHPRELRRAYDTDRDAIDPASDSVSIFSSPPGLTRSSAPSRRRATRSSWKSDPAAAR